MIMVLKELAHVQLFGLGNKNEIAGWKLQNIYKLKYQILM